MATKKKPVSRHRPGSGIPPNLYPEIRVQYLRGSTLIEIAENMGLCYDTLQRYVASTLRPEIHAAGVRHVGELLAEMQMLRKFAWEQLELGRSGVQHVTQKEAFEAAAKSGKKRSVAQNLARMVERVTKLMPNTLARNWATIITWCIEHEARIAGYYKQPTGMTGGDFRVAGYSPAEINEAMIARIREKVMAIREAAKAREQFVSKN